jgi:hypothetical protein
MPAPTRPQLDQQYDRYGQPLIQSPWTPDQVMDSDVDADGHSLTDLAGLSVGHKIVKEFCIGKRTAISGSRPAGHGSWEDPFDGTTKAQVDALIATAIAASGGSIIRFHPGSYEHSDFILPTGCELYGEGKDQTELLLSPSVASTIVNFLHAIRSSAGVRVEGFTLNLNYLALDSPPTECAINGVTLFGDGCVVRNVRVKNGYGHFGSLHEHFGIIIQNTATDSNINWLIEYCEVFGVHGNYGTAIASLCHYPSVVSIGGAVSKCLVKDYSKAATGVAGALHGITADSGSIENSTILNTDHAIYTEVGRGVKVYTNTIRDAYIYGILFNAVRDMLDCSIMYNDVEMRDDYAYPRAAIAFGTDGTHFVKNAQVDHNTLRLKATGSATADVSTAIQGIYLDDAHSLGWGNSYTHNKIDVAYPAEGITIPSDSYKIGNRRRLTGAAIVTILDSSVTAKIRFSAHGSATFSVPNAVATKLVFGSEEQDPDSVFASSTFTVPRAGDYFIRGYAETEFDNVSGYAQVLLYKNGSPFMSLGTRSKNMTSDTLGGTTVRLTLAANDTIELYGYQNSGSAGDFYLAYQGSFQAHEY